MILCYLTLDMNVTPSNLNISITLIGLALMLGLETMRPKRLWETPRNKRILFHIGLAVFNTAILAVVAIPLLVSWTHLVRARGWGVAPLLGLRGIPEILIGVAVLDMFDYWWHRFNHVIPFLWRFHKVHHVDTHVDVTTALRFHPGELLLSSLIAKVLWLFMWGPSLWGFAIFETAITSAAEFHHSNIDFSDPVEASLRKVLVTPRYHTAHHTVSKRTGNANYATIFIVWDKLFGTYREPDFEEMRTLGLPQGRTDYLSFRKSLRAPFTAEY